MMAAHTDNKVLTAQVSLATPDNIPDLIRIFWEAFSGPAESTFPHTDGGRKWLQRSFQNFLGQQSYYRPQTKVPVVRSPNGRPVSFAIITVAKPGQTVVGSSWKRRWSRADDLPDVSEERLANFFEPLAKAHHLTVGKEGHVLRRRLWIQTSHHSELTPSLGIVDIEFLITSSTWRHRGYATALMGWAARFSDDLGYACYLDGGGRGMGILERAGFVPKDIGYKYDETPPCVPMLRPKKGVEHVLKYDDKVIWGLKRSIFSLHIPVSPAFSYRSVKHDCFSTHKHTVAGPVGVSATRSDKRTQ
ncbi:hypothetical protein FHL15_003098 [Xylaria flabelliformis]|uniref:N-acetyltransferase domain-containing protein n=1 Tax=Xylaria flabelliformis TaxID=2512241 RepID=A0A553I6Y7_9PEZI|nr:hypothetical protein FHL15_003098 [Xylaria flabelliformis]